MGDKPIKWGMVHILDDFFIIEPTEQSGKQALKLFSDICQFLGIPLAGEKTFGPSQVLEFKGIELDTIKWEARLPSDKLRKCGGAIKALVGKSRVTLRELQSIIGLLNFACAVVIPGRAFLRRLINLTIGVSLPHHHIRMTSAARLDLVAWLNFLEGFNGRVFFMTEDWNSHNSLHLYTDAAGQKGYGAILGNQWFFGAWPKSWLSLNIVILELYPIVAAVHTWGEQVANKNLMIHTDNLALVYILNKTSSKDAVTMMLVRKLVLDMMRHNIRIRAVHIPGKVNILADVLSRLQVEQFKRLAPWASERPIEVPGEVLPENWCLR